MLSVRRLWLASFLLFFGLGATWSLATPVLANPDEPAHAVKAAALVRGQLVPPKLELPDEGPNSLVRGAFTTLVDVPAAYSWQTSTIPECYSWDSTVSASCAPDWKADAAPAEWTAFIGRYPPTYYAAVGWPSALTTGVQGFYAMRILTAALAAGLLATAMSVGASMRRLRLVPVAVAVAATPQVFIMNGSVNPNSLEVAAAVCVWATVCALLVWEGERVPRPLVVALTTSASLLAVTRPLSSMWLAVIAVCVLAAFGTRQTFLARFRERDIRMGAAVVALASATGATWTVLTDALGNNRGYNPWGLGLYDAAAHSLSLTGSYMEQSVAAFGWIRTTGPAALTIAWGVAAAALCLVAIVAGDRRRRLALLLVLAVWLLMPTLLQAPTAEDFGFVWSGRYGLALAAGVPMVAALIGGARSERVRGERVVVALIAFVVATVHVAAHVVGARRFTVGTSGPLDYFNAAGWRPPLGSLALLLSTVVCAVGIAVLAARSATVRP